KSGRRVSGRHPAQAGGGAGADRRGRHLQAGWPVRPEDRGAGVRARGGVRLAVLAALALGACGAPLVAASFRIYQFVQIVVYAIALLGLSVLTGFNGQTSLGHGAFYAMGAYATAILLGHTGAPYWATIPVAGAVCFGLGFLFGRPALRLEGPYLALAT